VRVKTPIPFLGRFVTVHGQVSPTDLNNLKKTK
jgi:hypothetical protein